MMYIIMICIFCVGNRALILPLVTNVPVRVGTFAVIFTMLTSALSIMSSS